MKRKIIALLLYIVCVFSLCFPVAADDDGYSAIIGDIDKTCPTCGSALHAFWWSTSGAEVEVEISDAGKIKIPAGAGAIAHVDLKCKSCGYEKKETRLLGLDFGAEKPGKLVQAPSGIGRKDLPGYNDDNGTPSISQDGKLYASMRHSWSRAYQSYNYLVWQCSHSSETLSDYCKGYMEVNQSSCDVPFKVTGDWLNGTSSGFYYRSRFYLIAPISGYYEVPEQVVGSASWESTRDSVQNRDIKVNVSRKFYQKGSAIECFIYVSPTESVESFIFRINKIPYVICEPYDTDYLQVWLDTYYQQQHMERQHLHRQQHQPYLHLPPVHHNQREKRNCHQYQHYPYHLQQRNQAILHLRPDHEELLLHKLRSSPHADACSDRNTHSQP